MCWPCSGVLVVLQVISVEPPNFVELEVTEAPPGVKGNTASGEYQQHHNNSAPSQLGSLGPQTAAAGDAVMWQQAEPHVLPVMAARRLHDLLVLADDAIQLIVCLFLLFVSAGGGSKIATLETGATIQVPLFINTGEIIKIDTRTEQYLSRAKEA